MASSQLVCGKNVISFAASDAGYTMDKRDMHF